MAALARADALVVKRVKKVRLLQTMFSVTFL
jgi:hypothetical protein